MSFAASYHRNSCHCKRCTDSFRLPKRGYDHSRPGRECRVKLLLCSGEKSWHSGPEQSRELLTSTGAAAAPRVIRKVIRTYICISYISLRPCGAIMLRGKKKESSRCVRNYAIRRIRARRPRTPPCVFHHLAPVGQNNITNTTAYGMTEQPKNGKKWSMFLDAGEAGKAQRSSLLGGPYQPG